jgi:hypothetical protein
MKRRGFIINSTLAAGGLTFYKPVVLNANDLSEVSETDDYKPSLENSVADDHPYHSTQLSASLLAF